MIFSSFVARMKIFAGPKSHKPDGIKRINEMLNKAFQNPIITPEAAPPSSKPIIRKTSKAGIDLIHQFESCAKLRDDGMVEAYLCPAKVWTIGWGSTGKDPFNGGKIRKETIWTQEQCDMHFKQHLAQFEKGVLEALEDKPTNQAQFDAMVCLAYNIGINAFANSTLLRVHKAGDFDGAAKQFLRWNKSVGKVLRGLTRRREAEAALYRGEQ